MLEILSWLQDSESGVTVCKIKNRYATGSDVLDGCVRVPVYVSSPFSVCDKMQRISTEKDTDGDGDRDRDSDRDRDRDSDSDSDRDRDRDRDRDKDRDRDRASHDHCKDTPCALAMLLGSHTGHSHPGTLTAPPLAAELPGPALEGEGGRRAFEAFLDTHVKQ